MVGKTQKGTNLLRVLVGKSLGQNDRKISFEGFGQNSFGMQNPLIIFYFCQMSAHKTCIYF